MTPATFGTETGDRLSVTEHEEWHSHVHKITVVRRRPRHGLYPLPMGPMAQRWGQLS